MAFQRPFLIILKREDPGQPWGFRVSGGADLATPPRVDKVVDGAPAALQGMHEGDLIIQVGKHNVQDLTEARINSLLAQPAKRLEIFIVREDFLQKPRKGEPSTVKAVVHNQYNSPLQLYSQEKVAETLAYHAQAITAEDGVNDIQPVGLPKTLVRSAVLQALNEDETGANPYRTANGTTVVQRATAPPTPPPKPRPPSYSGGSPLPERPYSSSGHHVTFASPGTPGTPPVQQHHSYIPPPPPLHSYEESSYQQPSYQQPSYQQPTYQQPSYQQPSYQQQQTSYPVQHARQSSYEEVDRRQQQIREAELRQRQYEEERLQQAQYEEGRFRQPPQDFRRAEYDAEQRRLREEEERQQRVIREEEKRRQQEEQERKRRQEQQEYEQYQQHQQQYQRYLEEQKRKDDELRRRNAGQQQHQYQQQPQQSQQPQQHQYYQQQQQRQLQEQEAARRRQLEEQHRTAQQQQHQQRYQNAQREPLNVQRAQQEAQRRFQPTTAAVSSPQYQEQVGSQAQRWESRIWEEQQARMPGTPLGSPSVSRRARDNVWPPKESSVRWTPKTGFSPQLARQSSQGAKQFVWPPQKTGVINGDECFPSRPPSRSAVNAWHPASPTSGTRTPPFARSPSLGRRTRDVAWPPPQADASPKFVPRPVSRTGLHRPDEFIHQNASCGVPPTYRPPPNSSQYL